MSSDAHAVSKSLKLPKNEEFGCDYVRLKSNLNRLDNFQIMNNIQDIPINEDTYFEENKYEKAMPEVERTQDSEKVPRLELEACWEELL